jgi:hypothetical protein
MFCRYVFVLLFVFDITLAVFDLVSSI